jgi:hypothetical protein
LFDNFFFPFVRQVAGHIGENETGAHCIDANIARGIFARGCFGDRDNSGFGRCVVRLAGAAERRGRADAGAELPVPGERERYKAAMSELGDRLQLVDMSGAISPSIGTGGISEIAQVLRQGVSKGLPPVGIVIDYAGIVVERMMASRNEKVDNEFAHLNRFVNNVRVEIASQFNIVTWVLHQLHGEAGASSPATRQHHSKARGARNFADNSNFAFNIGTKDPNNNCCLITCTKSRRAESMKDPPIVFMDGAFNRMIPADGKFALDVSQRRIVDKETINAVVDPAAISGVISKKPKTNIINGAGRFIREL